MAVKNETTGKHRIWINDFTVGEYFLFNNVLHMKIQENCKYKDIPINAVSLADGTAKCFADFHTLVEIKAKVVIE